MSLPRWTILLGFLFLCAWAAVAASAAGTVRLYLKDGGYHMVREYKVEQDRIRYYSTERGEWEEIPLEMVDLKKTEAEIRARESADTDETKAIDAEEKAERALRAEIASVPYEKGAFLVVEGEKTPKAMPQAEVKVQTSKGRQTLKILSPLPLSGKSTVEVEGEHAATVAGGNRPEFYIRLTLGQRFGIVKAAPKKGGVRVVQRLNLVPVANVIQEEQDEVDVYRKQVDDDLFKIWPTKPLEPGEYAVVEWQEGTGKILVWDFRVAAAK
jgi:hypothetical protein